jgi:hypothetical protein
MFGILISIILSVQVKKRDYSQKKSFNEKSISIEKNSKSDRRFLEENSLGCYSAYTNAVNSLSQITFRKQNINLKTYQEDLTKFQDVCKKTAEEGGPCAGTIGAIINEATVENVGKFQTDCVVAPPAADTADCFPAYEALIQALGNLDSRRSVKNILKVAPEEQYNAFLAQCTETTNSPACLLILNELPATGPTKANLETIKSECAVDNPNLNPNSNPNENSNPADENPADPKGDAGIASLNLNSKLILFISIVTHLCFLI